MIKRDVETYEGMVIDKNEIEIPVTLDLFNGSVLSYYKSQIITYKIQTSDNKILEIEPLPICDIKNGTNVEVYIISSRLWKWHLPTKRTLKYNGREVEISGFKIL